MFDREEASVFPRRLHQLERLEHAEGGRTLQWAVKTGVNRRCMAAAGIGSGLCAVEEKTARMKIRGLLKTHHLPEMGEAELLLRALAVGLGGGGVVVPIDVKPAQLALVLHSFNPIGHQ